MATDLSRRNALRAAAVAGIGGVVASSTSGMAYAEGAEDSARWAHGKLELHRKPFGTTPDGRKVDQFTFGCSNGLLVRMITYGAVVQTIEMPDRHGRRDDVVLGFDNIDDYVKKSPYFGATIGRYANRIAGGTFTLDGTSYHIPTNDGPNALHGGPEGFDKKIWDAHEVRERDRVGVRFRYVSPDGEMGFPGTLTTTVTYTVTSRGELAIEYHATTDKPTILNLTNHCYFNLAGEGSGTIYDHVATIDADRFTPIDDTSIPLGPLPSVAGTPFDFRRRHAFGERIRTGDQQIINALGYDHNWVLNGTGMRRVARVFDPGSGRGVECLTTQPGVQVYTGNVLDSSFAGISNRVYRQGDAFTLETQHYPDSPNEPDYPSTVLRPGQTFESETRFRFSVH